MAAAAIGEAGCAEVLGIEDWRAPALSCDPPNTDCDGTCEDLTSSSTDCGACGHDCLGATCSSGMCVPEQLVSGQGAIARIAVDATSVYWVVSGIAPCEPPECTLDRVPKSGGAVEILAGDIREVTGMVLDDTHVYVSAYTAGSGDGIRRVPIAGGASETIDNCNTAFNVTVDDNHVFWVSGECGSSSIHVRRAVKSDPTQTIEQIDATPDAYAYATYGYMAAGPDDIYWLNAAAVMKAPKSMVQIETLVDAPGLPRGIVRDDDGLWVVFGRDIYAVSEDGSSVSPIAVMQMALPPDSSTFKGIATDATHVYWPADIDGGASGGKIVKRAKLPAEAEPVVLAIDQAAPTGVAVDETHVYWANADGTIHRVAK